MRYQFWFRELARVVSSVGPEQQRTVAPDLKADQLKRSLPAIHSRECGLTGWAGTAKGPDAARRNLNLRYQFWFREWARVVSSVGPETQWAFAPDLKADQLKRSLPIIHCRECGLTGWAGTAKDMDHRLNPDLDT